jgi:hypothetical protein
LFSVFPDPGSLKKITDRAHSSEYRKMLPN